MTNPNLTVAPGELALGVRAVLAALGATAEQAIR